MQGYLAFGPTSFDCGGTSISIGLWSSPDSRNRRVFSASATVDGRRNHYSVLGIPSNASSSDIKRAYRLLALKYHPDVNKGIDANDAFKNIRLAYDILNNKATRNEYDQALQYQESAGRHFRDESAHNTQYEDGVRFYRWAYMRREMRYKQYYEQKHTTEEHFSFYDDNDEASDEENLDEEREPFVEVLKSAFLTIFLMQTVGIRLSLTFSSLMGLVDRKLDAGYKFGYIFAWILGGRGGILLTMFLSFASWICGKTSSSLVAFVVFAMWLCSNLARYAPLPQGALLTLLYMSVKLQIDLS